MHVSVWIKLKRARLGIKIIFLAQINDDDSKPRCTPQNPRAVPQNPNLSLSTSFCIFITPLVCSSAPDYIKNRFFPALRELTHGEYSSKRGSSNAERETTMLPGCHYNHWLVVLEFPKDPAPTREQMIETYLNTLATVLGSMEEVKKDMYAFSTTTYTGFQCTVSEETSEKFKGLPGVLWVLPDSYTDVKNKDYGGDKYINGEITPCQYPTYQPKQARSSKYKSKAHVRQRDGPPSDQRRTRQGATPESAS